MKPSLFEMQSSVEKPEVPRMDPGCRGRSVSKWASGPLGCDEEDCVSLQSWVLLEAEGSSCRNGRQAGTEALAKPLSSRSSPQEAAWLARVGTLSPSFLFDSQSARNPVLDICSRSECQDCSRRDSSMCVEILRQTRFKRMRSQSKQRSSQVPRKQLPCAHDEMPARMEVVWTQADVDKNASRNLRVQFRFDCPQTELCWIMLPERGWGWGNNPADLQPLV